MKEKVKPEHDCNFWQVSIGSTIGGHRLTACAKCGRVLCPEIREARIDKEADRDG